MPGKETCPDHSLLIASYERLEQNQKDLATSITGLAKEQTETKTEIRFLAKGVDKLCQRIEKNAEEKLSEAKIQIQEVKAEKKETVQEIKGEAKTRVEMSLKKISIIITVIGGVFGFLAPLMNALGTWVLSLIKP